MTHVRIPDFSHPAPVRAKAGTARRRVPTDGRYLNLPNEPQPGTIEPWQAVTAPEILPPLTGPALRASLEEAAQTALDAADRIIAVLDRMDGDADHEDGADDEPPLAPPANPEGKSRGCARMTRIARRGRTRLRYPKWQPDLCRPCREAGEETCSPRLG